MLQLMFRDKTGLITLSANAKITFEHMRGQSFNQTYNKMYVYDYNNDSQFINISIEYKNYIDYNNLINFITNSKVNYMQYWFLIKLPYYLCDVDNDLYLSYIVPSASLYATYNFTTLNLAVGDSVDYNASADEKAIITYNDRTNRILRLKPTDFSILPENGDTLRKVGSPTYLATLNMDVFYPVRLIENSRTEKINSIGNLSTNFKLQIIPTNSI